MVMNEQDASDIERSCAEIAARVDADFENNPARWIHHCHSFAEACATYHEQRSERIERRKDWIQRKLADQDGHRELAINKKSPELHLQALTKEEFALYTSAEIHLLDCSFEEAEINRAAGRYAGGILRYLPTQFDPDLLGNPNDWLFANGSEENLPGVAVRLIVIHDFFHPSHRVIPAAKRRMDSNSKSWVHLHSLEDCYDRQSSWFRPAKLFANDISPVTATADLHRWFRILTTEPLNETGNVSGDSPTAEFTPPKTHSLDLETDDWPPDDGWHFRPGRAAYLGIEFEVTSSPISTLLERLARARRPHLARELIGDSGWEDGTLRTYLARARKLLKSHFVVTGDPVPAISTASGSAWQLHNERIQKQRQ